MRPTPALWMAAALALAACSTSPPTRLLQLRAEPPGLVPAPPAEGLPVWQIGPLQLPAYLDRDALLLPEGRSGLQAVPGQRWAEPLRDAIPRLLLADLARLRGPASVFAGPLPPGLKAERQLRVELLRLDAEPDGGAVQLLARWWLQDPSGQQPPLVRSTTLRAESPSASADDLAATHRALLWQLAGQIASQGR